MENIKISFIVSENLPKVSKDDKTALDFIFDKGYMFTALFYDFRENPLYLRAKVNEGDSAELCILPYRVELYINGKLEDEEWPCGSNYLSADILPDCFTVSNYTPAKVEKPSVLGSFENAEGWKPEENVFVGDCMPYENDGVYHVLYLKDRHHHCSKWGFGAHQWDHISTTDFIHWDIHPTAVEIDSPAEGSICTGSWIKKDDKQYLFYTVRTCDYSPAKICRSISNDGYHFEKDRNFVFELGERYTASSARDPKVVLSEDGKFHMILTTSLRKEFSPFDEQRGCLVHLISDDLDTWTEADQPIYISDNNAEPECPDYFTYNGKYYLIFSLGSHGNYLYSEKPFSDFKKPADPIIPCKSVPKMAVWNNRIIFSGFDGHGNYAGTMTFTEAEIGENGEMSYKKL